MLKCKNITHTHFENIQNISPHLYGEYTEISCPEILLENIKKYLNPQTLENIQKLDQVSC